MPASPLQRRPAAPVFAPADASSSGEVAARLMGRLASDFLLRALAELAGLFDGDVMMGVVFLTLGQASIADAAALARLDVFEGDGVVPNEKRRSVTTLAMANSLNMPRETVRRYVNRLVELGFCERVEGRRLIVSEAVMRRPDVLAALIANQRHLSRLIDRLKRERLA